MPERDLRGARQLDALPHAPDPAGARARLHGRGGPPPGSDASRSSATALAAAVRRRSRGDEPHADARRRAARHRGRDAPVFRVPRVRRGLDAARARAPTGPATIAVSRSWRASPTGSRSRARESELAAIAARPRAGVPGHERGPRGAGAAAARVADTARRRRRPGAPAGGRPLRPAHRLRQRREPAARQGDGAAPRGRHAAGAGRRPRPPAAAVHDRDAAAVGRRRRARVPGSRRGASSSWWPARRCSRRSGRCTTSTCVPSASWSRSRARARSSSAWSRRCRRDARASLDAVREGSRTVAGGSRGRLARLLVVCRARRRPRPAGGRRAHGPELPRRYAIDPGFDAQARAHRALSLSGDAYADPARRADFLEELVRRLRDRPEVRRGGDGERAALQRSAVRRLVDATLRGRGAARSSAGRSRPPPTTRVSSGYLRATGLRLRAGRLFSGEEEAEARDVAVISDDLAGRLWSGSDPVGRRLRIEAGAWLRVVGRRRGDAGGRRHAAARRRDRAGQIYVPYRADAREASRSSCGPARSRAALAGALRETRARVWTPRLPLDAVLTLDEVRARASWVARLWGRMFSAGGGRWRCCSPLSASTGSCRYMVSQRTHEIGIRMAIGADARRRGPARRPAGGLRLALQAVAVGLMAALLLTSALSRLLYGVDARDPADAPSLRGSPDAHRARRELRPGLARDPSRSDRRPARGVAEAAPRAAALLALAESALP